MKISRVHIGSIYLVLLMICFSPGLAKAMGFGKGAGTSAPLEQSYVWYDGDREHTVWLDPTVVAEFNPGPADQSPLTKSFAGARVIPGKQAAVRFWQVDSIPAATAVRSLKEQYPGGKFSPVMHDGPSTGSRKRALPGNVIVYLNPAWDGAAVQRWADSQGLQIVKRLQIGPNIYIIRTGAGIEALEKANALYKSGSVVAAFPDWWQEVSTR